MSREDHRPCAPSLCCLPSDPLTCLGVGENTCGGGLGRRHRREEVTMRAWVWGSSFTGSLQVRRHRLR